MWFVKISPQVALDKIFSTSFWKGRDNEWLNVSLEKSKARNLVMMKFQHYILGEGVCNFSMIFMLKPKDFTWEVENNKLKDSGKLNICRIMELIWEMSQEIKKRCNAFPFWGRNPNNSHQHANWWVFSDICTLLAELASIKALFRCLLESLESLWIGGCLWSSWPASSLSFRICVFRICKSSILLKNTVF